MVVIAGVKRRTRGPNGLSIAKGQEEAMAVHVRVAWTGNEG